MRGPHRSRIAWTLMLVGIALLSAVFLRPDDIGGVLGIGGEPGIVGVALCVVAIALLVGGIVWPRRVTADCSECGRRESWPAQRLATRRPRRGSWRRAAIRFDQLWPDQEEAGKSFPPTPPDAG